MSLSHHFISEMLKMAESWANSAGSATPTPPRFLSANNSKPLYGGTSPQRHAELKVREEKAFNATSPSLPKVLPSDPSPLPIRGGSDPRYALARQQAKLAAAALIQRARRQL